MLDRDQGCIKDLLWRLELPDPAALADRLKNAGWIDRSAFAQLRDLESPTGHRLIVVPRTGRIQLRIHYLTPRPRRADAARAVYDHLARM